MKVIVFDLEFTVANKWNRMNEIIEIGAIELAVENNDVYFVDLFHTYVRPTNQLVISDDTIKLTGISQPLINAAPTFKTAIEQFKLWLGQEDYYLAAWGPCDRRHLVQQCRQEKIALQWLKNYTDLQCQFSKLNKTGEAYAQIGLKRSLEMMNLHLFGTHHCALDDAFNTAKLFKLLFKQFQLERNQAHDFQLHTSELVYSTGQFEQNLPFSHLQQLLQRTV